MRFLFSVILLLVFSLVAPQALAQAPEPGAQITYDAVLTSDVVDLANGGLKPGVTVLHNLELTAVWKGADGWEVHGDILGDFDGGVSSRRIGDIQGVDNIDTRGACRLFEAYVKRTYADGHLVSSFGIMNLNNVFDVQKYARLFLNSSHGIGPEFSQTGPSVFPVSGLGTMTSWIINDENTIKLGVFDGVSGDPLHKTVFVSVKLSHADGLNYIAEYKRTFDGGAFKLDHWGYTTRAPRLDGTGVSGNNTGTYAQFAYTLTREANAPDQGLKGWVRLGVANGQLEAIDQYRGMGLYYVGPIDRHDSDQVGFAIAQAHFGLPYRQMTAGQRAFETDYELSYSAAVTKAITLQPDIQYVVNPSGRRDIPNATVLMLRTTIDFMAF